MYNWSRQWTLDGKVCGQISIDINGAKAPNVIGRDFFTFWITKTGVFPIGSGYDTKTCESNSSSKLTSDGCAAQVLQEGAMNY